MGILRGKLLPPALAILFSALLCGIALLISGANPLRAFGAMVLQVGEGTTAVDIVNSTSTYYIAALAVAVGFQMNLFNIGVEGQYRVAAVVAAVVGGSIALPTGVHTLVIILTAAVAGAAWAAIPAVLKVTRGVNEVISTIMMNGLAMGVSAYLISRDMFGELRGNNIRTPEIPETGWVPGIDLGGAGTVYGLVVLAIALGVGYWVMMNRTRFGFELRASGQSATAAAAGGVNAKRMVLIAMLMSGAIAGLVSMPEILGRNHTFDLNFPAGIGFTGIAIALLGRNHPGGIALGALLWAFLDKAGLALDNQGVPREIVTIMQGSIVLSVVVAYEVVRRFEVAAQQRRVGQQLGTVEASS
ncbi:ABC transporter permease [Actinosynnema pretiosum subsp. pretiosum]|uniref:Inner-membrane translocator n=3 Tax=Actinosynnema TaxID=40566 RepID=C6WKK2_ACTMD|nr:MULTISPECIES: ABC transporter permease [Actinosynnema]ACU40253.1 inner-membrane translocator [Actinosynnema mirum DSM 43827]ATE57296.1 ABC transporter permease [Actinosynnema pretiosum]AXX33763.1 Nucleoside ABC transporter, permease protein 1 [Actinosynnema pretiosum subsp. pretiosum]QUF02467.1 ABC transporter permease [Actinosynnema pretiosum subsp. pretiosum]